MERNDNFLSSIYFKREIFKKKILFNVCKFIHPSNECCHCIWEIFISDSVVSIIIRLHVLNIWTSKKIRKKSFSKIKKDFLCNRDFALPSIRKIWFQYDEVSSRIGRNVTNFLNIHHPDRWWEGNRKSPRSLDLIPLFFWDYMKSKCVKQWWSRNMWKITILDADSEAEMKFFHVE